MTSAGTSGDSEPGLDGDRSDSDDAVETAEALPSGGVSRGEHML